MDADRFDSLTRSLMSSGSRRRALGAVAGGVLGLLGLADSDDASAAKSGKCKPRCGECARCKRGGLQEDQARQEAVQPGQVSAAAGGNALYDGNLSRRQLHRRVANFATPTTRSVATPVAALPRGVYRLRRELR